MAKKHKKKKNRSDSKNVVSSLPGSKKQWSIEKKGGDLTTKNSQNKQEEYQQLVLDLDAEVYEAIMEIKELFAEAVWKEVSDEEVIWTLVSGFIAWLNEEHEEGDVVVEWWCCGSSEWEENKEDKEDEIAWCCGWSCKSDV